MTFLHFSTFHVQQKQSHCDLYSESGQAVHRYKWNKVRCNCWKRPPVINVVIIVTGDPNWGLSRNDVMPCFWAKKDY
jgi:hypothetical protein